jgi:DHA1 family tetracycline resistance protein-like MFS transporter
MTQAQSISPEEKLDFKKIFPIFVIVLVDLLGLTIIIPLLPLYAASFGADPLVIGALGTAYPLMQLVGAPLLGGLSDCYGRKPILLISQVGTFIGFIIMGLANSLPLLFLARLIDGLSGANTAAAQAAITDSTTEKTRAQGLGLMGAAFGLGFIIGPVIAFIALAIGKNDYHLPAYIAAACSAISILLTTFWFQETLPADKRGTSHIEKAPGTLRNILTALNKPLVGTLLVLMFMQQLVFGGFENLLALFTLNRLGVNAAGNAVIFVFAGMIIVLVQGKYIGPWSRRFGERKLIYAGLLLLAIGLIMTAITPHQTVPWYSRVALERELTQSQEAATRRVGVELPPDGNNGWLGLIWTLAAMIPAAVGGGILSPSINSLITKRIARSEIGSTLGVSSALVSAANAATPIIGGAVFKALGSSAPFLIGGGILAVLFVVALQIVVPSPEERVGFSPTATDQPMG